MSAPHTKTDLIEQLTHVQRGVIESVEAIPSGAFDRSRGEGWSAAGYLKHLILSIKPFARALKFSAEQLRNHFGQPDRPSRSYDELVSVYQARLDAGARAEDYDRVTPDSYRMPDGVEDVRAYLLQTWNDSNNRLLDALRDWNEADLDGYQLPHPAVGMVTVREMLFFTLYHNSLHWRDIQQVSV